MKEQRWDQINKWSFGQCCLEQVQLSANQSRLEKSLFLAVVNLIRLQQCRQRDKFIIQIQLNLHGNTIHHDKMYVQFKAKYNISSANQVVCLVKLPETDRVESLRVHIGDKNNCLSVVSHQLIIFSLHRISQQSGLAKTHVRMHVQNNTLPYSSHTRLEQRALS